MAGEGHPKPVRCSDCGRVYLLREGLYGWLCPHCHHGLPERPKDGGGP